jgi:CHAD domain-containing protein
VVHQARVGWRRFRSALRLFKPVFAGGELPSWQALKVMLSFLGELRARLEVDRELVGFLRGVAVGRTKPQ